jgi:poly(3-hydroxybutyrate) depolymerase
VTSLQATTPVDLTGALPGGPAWLHDGRTTQLALQADPRFSYNLYLPGFSPGQPPRFAGLLVSVHGSDRDPAQASRAFQAYADQAQVAVLAPLFPAGVADVREADAYKFLGVGYPGGLRYDLLLLAMVAEAAQRFGTQGQVFDLVGFSGGAQFVHRFCYVHPDRVRAACVAAPGRVTLPDVEEPFPVGLADVARHFGRPVDAEALRRVRMHVVVGSQDREAVPDPVLTSAPRVEQAERLHRALRDFGIASTFETVPGARHDYLRIVPAINRFLSDNALKESL